MKPISAETKAHDRWLNRRSHRAMIKHILKTYGILALSLLALFGSGMVTGRLTAQRQRPPGDPAAAGAKTPEAWVAAASQGLVRELDLSADQERQVRDRLVPVSTALHADQQRALFQMHLRLLLFHDSLATSGLLEQDQAHRLAASRAKLRDLIIARFPDMVRGNPVLAAEETGK
jgi:hypothetical protein